MPGAVVQGVPWWRLRQPDYDSRHVFLNNLQLINCMQYLA